ncbi:MAG: hypothetical protein DCE90_03655 [Pseudanabaena sp.]|nr:MAG: hypothetical protein DCE90_03655 [Pseudanabaena sp.]
MQTGRIIFADILRIIAIIAVITLHSTVDLFRSYGSVNIDWWWLGNILNCSSKWAVPIFVMLSGMLLLDPSKSFSFKSFLNKRLPKILIPLFFWTIFYELYIVVLINKLNIDLPQLIKNIYTGEVHFHLWFLYMIIGLYLFTPIFRYFIKTHDEFEIQFFLCIWFIVNGIVNSLDTFFDIQNGFYLNLFVGFSGYYVLGYYLNTKLYNRKHRYIAIATLIFSVATSAILIFFLFTNNFASKVDIVIDNISLFTIINTICIFIIVKSIDWESLLKNNTSILNIIKSLSLSSYGIYLIHIVIIYLLSSNIFIKIFKVGINYKLVHPLVGVPLTVILTVILSYFSVQILKKIKFANNIVP